MTSSIDRPPGAGFHPVPGVFNLFASSRCLRPVTRPTLSRAPRGQCLLPLDLEQLHLEYQGTVWLYLARTTFAIAKLRRDE